MSLRNILAVAALSVCVGCEVTQPDGDETEQVSSTVSYNQPNKPVILTITSPTDGTTVSGTVELSADSSGPNSVAAKWFVDDTLIGTDDHAPYTASWDTTTWANGTYTIAVVVFYRLSFYNDEIAVAVAN